MTTSRGGIEEERIVIVLKHPDGRIKQRWTRTIRHAGITDGSKDKKNNPKRNSERSLS